MLSNKVYPSSYFDPYRDEGKAQCAECGDWFEAGEILDVEEVTDLTSKNGFIYQGVCPDCKENKEL